MKLTDKEKETLRDIGKTFYSKNKVYNFNIFKCENCRMILYYQCLRCPICESDNIIKIEKTSIISKHKKKLVDINDTKNGITE